MVVSYGPGVWKKSGRVQRDIHLVQTKCRSVFVTERRCNRDEPLVRGGDFPKNATTAFQDGLQTATSKLIELMGKARDVSRDDKEQFEPQRGLDQDSARTAVLLSVTRCGLGARGFKIGVPHGITEKRECMACKRYKQKWFLTRSRFRLLWYASREIAVKSWRCTVAVSV